VDPRSTSFKVWEFPERLVLAAAQPFEELPFNAGPDGVPTVQQSDLVFEVAKPGVLEGLVLHIVLELDALDVRQNLSSWCSQSHWANVFVPMTDIEVKLGDRVHVAVVTDTDRPTPEYTFKLRVESDSVMGPSTSATTVH